MTQRVLIVDDEESIATLLQYNINQAGFEAVTVHDGLSALNFASKGKFDLIVLDIMLPEMDGMEVCKRLRAQKIQTPILMLTAKEEEFDKILGLELGADDYLTKPFSPREVVARIKAILRRTSKEKFNDTTEDEVPNQLKIGNLVILPDHYEVYMDGKDLTFTPKEFELLLFLAKNKGRVLSRDQLLSSVWNYDFMGDTRIVDVHISHLRDKIEPDTKKPSYIKTIRGLGYKLEEPK